MKRGIEQIVSVCLLYGMHRKEEMENPNRIEDGYAEVETAANVLVKKDHILIVEGDIR